MTLSVPERSPAVEPTRNNNVVAMPAPTPPAQKSSQDPWANYTYAVDHYVLKMPPETQLKALEYLKAKIGLAENAENSK